MDTGAYMANQMDEQIERGIRMNDEFNEWLFEACSFKSKHKEPQEIFSKVDLTDARCAFSDGMSPEEYSKEI